MRSATSKTWGMLWLMRTMGRPAPLHVQDQFQHAARFLDAKGGGRLVHDHDPAAESGGPRHGDALALAAGEGFDRLVDVLDGRAGRARSASRARASAWRAGRACGTGGRAPVCRRISRPRNSCRRWTAPATAPGSDRPSRCRPGAHPSASGSGSACRRDGSRHHRA